MQSNTLTAIVTALSKRVETRELSDQDILKHMGHSVDSVAITGLQGAFILLRHLSSLVPYMAFFVP